MPKTTKKTKILTLSEKEHETARRAAWVAFAAGHTMDSCYEDSIALAADGFLKLYDKRFPKEF